ncbi:MAR-binding filament-like protein 1-1 [Nicotiana tomentosiformis]|uniref:MAR-binding filament-like protein 1-1 n=1 Tax=Nicotiana tomentosiformis TaxID=4098 RepID=UPI00388C386A
MAKTSKSVPKKEAHFENVSHAAIEEPPLKSYIPVGCPTVADFKASVFHHEAFFRYREESKYFEAEARELAEKRDAYKLLNEKSQAEMEAARREHTELVEQVQNKLDVIEQLRGEVDAVKVEIEEWKKNMDLLASEKETARTQLASAEVQLQAAKEKNLAQDKMAEGIQSQLTSAVSGQENLAKELEASKLEVITAQNEADKKVAQLKVDVEAIHEQAKNMVKHAKWESRRGTLEGVHAQNFDILTEIENAKTCETNARRLAFPEEDSEASEESGQSGGEEDPVGDDVALNED